ncbi:MAG TPA: hypothetical protein VFX59_14075 [Polyangiales bacterium]|nr:hypothetical protein [Polyangiales bacterium]
MRNIRTLVLPALLTLTSCVGDAGSYGMIGGPTCIEFGCLWTTEQGSVEEVGSWREEQTGHRLVGMPARISRDVDVSAIPDCVEVKLTADVARDAQLELQFDFNSDGSVEVRVPVEPGEWKKRTYYVRAPSAARHLRTSFAKLGPGQASFEYMVLERGDDHCAGLPATTLADGSACLNDASCTSNYCVLGKCSPCAAGGCAEGTACGADKDCMAGACAAGVCRACAANGSCGTGDGCTASTQCASGTCAFGNKPSLIRYPELDGVCGECNADDDCGGKKCVNGQCSDCATDADCGAGLRCRYTDAFEANARSCVPRFDAILPRGALCEVDAECTGGLRCGGGTGRAKRCGTSCRIAADCVAGEVCGETGSVPGLQAATYELAASYTAQSSARIRTCYAPYVFGGYGTTTPCEVHAQCTASTSIYPLDPDALGICCGGGCVVYAADLATGSCNYDGTDYEFARFYN